MLLEEGVFDETYVSGVVLYNQLFKEREYLDNLKHTNTHTHICIKFASALILLANEIISILHMYLNDIILFLLIIVLFKDNYTS